MAVTYQKPDVLIYQKFVSAAASAVEPILSACIVGHSFQIEEDTEVATFSSSQNLENVYRGGSDTGLFGQGPGQTLVVDKGKDEYGNPNNVKIELEGEWAYIRDVEAPYPTVWSEVDGIWAEDVYGDAADWIVITGGSGYTSNIKREILEVVDDTETGGKKLRVRAGQGVTSATDATYYIVRRVFVDYSYLQRVCNNPGCSLEGQLQITTDTVCSGDTGGGPGSCAFPLEYWGGDIPNFGDEASPAANEVQTDDYICLFGATGTAHEYDRFPVYLKVKDVYSGTFEGLPNPTGPVPGPADEFQSGLIVAEEDIEKIMDAEEQGLQYHVYSQAFIPIEFPLPNLEDGAIYFNDSIDVHGDPNLEDLKVCNPILKLTGDVQTKIIPNTSFEVIQLDDGTPLVRVYSAFTADDERVRYTTATAIGTSVYPLEEGSLILTDSSQNFNTLGVLKGDVIEYLGEDIVPGETSPDSVWGDDGAGIIEATVVSIVNENQLKLNMAATSDAFAGGGAFDFPYRIVSKEFFSGRITCTYRALRTSYVGDIVRAANIDDIEQTIPPVSPDNPLAWGMYMALKHTDTEVLGTMVEDIITEPYYDVIRTSVGDISLSTEEVEQGTGIAFDSAFEFLEGQDVYAITPLSWDTTVHQAAFTHVTEMSQPSKKLERITLINPRLELAEVRIDTSTGGSIEEYETRLKKFSVDPTSDVNFQSEGVLAGEWLQILEPTRLLGSYKIAGLLSHQSLELETPVAGALQAESGLTWRIVSDMYDKTEQEQAVASYAGSYNGGVDDDGDPAYNDRRIVCVWPDYCKVEDQEGVVQTLPGWYLACGVAGMISGFEPQQGFTNLSMTGFEELLHSNNYFTQDQLNELATGGVYIIVQDKQNEPVYSRHQLTAAFDLISTRELSIIKNVDFISKFIRIGLRRYIGVYNITETFKSILKMATQSLINWLTSNGSLNSATLDSLEVDEDNPDTIIMEITLGVPYPCNYIKVTLYI